MWRQFIRVIMVLGVTCGIIAGHAALVHADTLQSNNYKFDETDLGGGGLNQSSSANYGSVLSIGDNAIANGASSSFQFDAGSQQSPDPALAFIVTNGSATFPTFSATTASTATTNFTISNYTSYGYIVQITGTPPKNGSHTIDPITPSSPDDTSQPGTEQFGINLVANTSPTSVGSNPIQSLFGVGIAEANYNTPNHYRFVSGETIASAPKSSGVTAYTISYMVNVGFLTPGGQYTSNQSIVVVGTY
jgi:hypothetical protein